MKGIPANWIQCPSCKAWSHPAAKLCSKCGSAKEYETQSSLARAFEDAENVSSERQLQNDSFAWLSQNGASAIVWHFRMDKATTCFSGVSDFVFLFRGKFVAAEAKIGANKATKAQQEYIDAVNANGGIGFVFRSVDELRANLEQITL